MILTAVIGLFAVGGIPVSAADVVGKKPRHVWGGPSSVPNERALTKRIWAPGIDDGYVPQGVTWADGAVYLSAYRSTEPKVGTGPCRIYKVDPESGAVLGQFDLPSDCGHAGGLAYIGKGVLVVSDTRRLYRVDIAVAFGSGPTTDAVTARIGLSAPLRGSFIDFDGSSLFVGAFDKDPRLARGYYLPLSIFDTHRDAPVTEDVVIRAIPLPVEAQGAAFDKAGVLWVSASSSRFGALQKLDSTTGAVLASYEMVIGIEDLSFDTTGGLWSVSEAGSLRWSNWSKTFPVLFRTDVDRLK